MQKITATDPQAQSADIIADNLEQLKNLFPEAFAEGKVQFEVLKQLLGGAVDEADEKYGLNWHGKRRARQIALTPSTGTLRPCPEESVDWDTTQNLMIEGDNLEVLKLLQKSYAGKVKLIYIDPPYNTGSDFVYPDNFQDTIKSYLELTGQTEGRMRLNANPESSGRFHTDWLNMLYPRLRLARGLLAEDGVIFISIDDGELGNLLLLMNELFGEENFRANISWQKRYTRSNNTVDFTTVVEHIVVYSKSDLFSVNLLERTKEADARYSNPDNDHRGPWKGASILNPATPQQRPNLCYPIQNPNTGEITSPTKNAWRRSQQEFEKLSIEGRLYWGSDGRQPLPSIKMFLSEAREITPINFWEHGYAGNTDDGSRDLKNIFGDKVFDNPKPVKLIQRVIEHATEKDSLVLDFFAGSGTTGQAVLAQNAIDGGTRRFILVQLPEVLDANDKAQFSAAKFCADTGLSPKISEITKERLRRAGHSMKSDGGLLEADIGFRVLKLDESNLSRWSPDSNNLSRALQSSSQHLLPYRTESDILFELILRFGLDLALPIGVRKVETYNIYELGGGVVYACLAAKIPAGEIERIASSIIEWNAKLQPIGMPTSIFLDSAFENDVSKLNLTAILEQHGLGIVRSI